LEIYNQSINLSVLLTRLEALKAKIPDEKKTRKIHRAFADKFIETMLDGFNFTSEIVDLSKEEITALEYYFYANYLIIQCKDAAVRVSRETWEAIEGRMLLPPGN
jgi:hypothetical protein